MEQKGVEELETPAINIPAHAWVVLVGVFLGSLAAPVAERGYNLMLTVVINHQRYTDLGPLLWLSPVVILAAILPAGLLARRPGVRLAGLGALAFTAAGAALAALASGRDMAVASSVALALGGGMMAVIAPAAIALWFPAGRRGLPLGLWLAHGPLAQLGLSVFFPPGMLGPGYALPRWLAVGYALGALVLYGLLVRNPPAPDSGVETHRPSRPTFAGRNVLLLALALMCFSLVDNALVSFMPVVVSQTYGRAPALVGALSLVSALGVLIAAPLGGRLLDRFGFHKGVLALLFGVVGVLLLFVFDLGAMQTLVFLFVLGLIAGQVSVAVFTQAAGAPGTAGMVGLALAVVVLGRVLGLLAGPVVFGLLAGAQGYVGAGYMLIPVCLVGAAAALGLKTGDGIPANR